jgi:hypothetical protein
VGAVRAASSVLIRLMWAALCVAIWPFYYAVLLARWFLVGVRWVTFRETLDEMSARDDRLMEMARRPPFIEHLRG